MRGGISRRGLFTVSSRASPHSIRHERYIRIYIHTRRWRACTNGPRGVATTLPLVDRLPVTSGGTMLQSTMPAGLSLAAHNNRCVSSCSWQGAGCSRASLYVLCQSLSLTSRSSSSLASTCAPCIYSMGAQGTLAYRGNTPLAIGHRQKCVLLQWLKR